MSTTDSTTFLHYATPHADTVFSQPWFYKLTAGDFDFITFPIPATTETYDSKWEWCQEEPYDSSIAIDTSDVIPAHEDVTAITFGMNVAFSSGFRSVKISFTNKATKKNSTFVYHFAKFYLFAQLIYHESHISATTQLLKYIRLEHPTSTALLAILNDMPILSNLSGFHDTFPVWQLSSLCDEQYLWDSVVNAGLEMQYARKRVLDGSNTPPYLVLSTLVFDEILQSSLTSAEFSATIIALRHRIADNGVLGFAFILASENHYTPFLYRKSSGCLFTSDSSGLPPPPSVLDAVRWFLKGMGLRCPPIVSEVGPRQGVRSGSCGIASLSYIECHMNLTAVRWTGDADSRRFRDRLLTSILQWHSMSVGTKIQSMWDYLGDFSSSGIGIPDYNLANLNVSIGSSSTAISSQAHMQPNHIAHRLPSTVFQLPEKASRVGGAEMDSDSEADLITRPFTLSRRQQLHMHSPGSTIKKEPVDVSPVPKPAGVIDLTNSPTPPPTRKLRINPDGVIDVSSDSESQSVIDVLDDSTDALSRTQAPISAGDEPQLGDVFNSLEEAIAAVYAFQEGLGHPWHKNQSKKSANGGCKKLTLRCDRYRKHIPVHDQSIDPADHRQGRSARLDCFAHVNLNRVPDSSQFYISLADWDHNHDRLIPVGGTAQHPPTKAHKDLVAQYANGHTKFTRQQLKTIVQNQGPAELEDRQLSNLINDARRKAREEIERHGGDVASVVAQLEELTAAGEPYNYKLLIDEETNVVKAVWWQSAEQEKVSRRYHDILINDNTFNRNRYQYVLDIGIIIDSAGHSRNIWYAVHKEQTADIHRWVLRLHRQHAGQDPELVATDQHPSLVPVIPEVLPTSFHLLCLHHVHDNAFTHARRKLGAGFDSFQNAFWSVSRAVSPEAFDRQWQRLLSDFPEMAEYLKNQLYPCRRQWAWAWVSSIFSAGVRTTGRSEAENNHTKRFGGPKSTLLELFEGLNERTRQQSKKEKETVRDSSRQNLRHNVESLFPRVLLLLRKHVGSFALQKMWREMVDCTYYNVETFHLLPPMTWDKYAASLRSEVPQGFEWINGEETQFINTFENDQGRISLDWMLELILGRGLQIRALYQVTRLGGTKVTHWVAALSDGRYICDCAMGTNLGIPCRHYFAVFSKVVGATFHLAFVRARWLSNPELDVSTIPPVTLQHAVHEQALHHASRPIPTHLFSNPFDVRHNRSALSAPPANHTLNQREVYHQANAALRDLLPGVETQEEVAELVQQIRDIRDLRNPPPVEVPMIVDPPVHRHRGRPRTLRLTSAAEGKASGGGSKKRQRTANEPDITDRADLSPSPTHASVHDTTEPTANDGPPPRKKRVTRCSQCGETGHNRRNCYDRTVEIQKRMSGRRRG